jgi:two-component system cell cycle response regulator
MVETRNFDVLVVDDEPDKRGVIAMRLKLEGHNVREAENAAEALELFEQSAPDLLVTDISMPGLDGFQLIERVQQNPLWTDIPVLIQTAHATTPEHMTRAAELGALAYVTDPTNLDLLIARARVLLKLKERLDTLTEQASTDALTGIANRRRFNARLERELSRAARTRRPFCLILLDLDHFKRINDEFGHPRGDDVLACVGELLAEHIRGMDTAARYGGEEFALIVPETGVQGGIETAERLRRAIQSDCLSVGVGTVTCSFGVAEYPSDVGANGNHAQGLIAAADRALYAAKQGGRNRVCIASEVAVR